MYLILVVAKLLKGCGSVTGNFVKSLPRRFKFDDKHVRMVLVSV